MKTIEEREVAFGKREIRHSNGILWEAGYREGSKVGYHFGATEQKALDDDAMHAIVEEQVLKAIEKQKAIDIKQLKDWLKHNIVKYAGMFTEHFEDEDGRETIKVCPCVDAALYDDLEKAMQETK